MPITDEQLEAEWKKIRNETKRRTSARIKLSFPIHEYDILRSISEQEGHGDNVAAMVRCWVRLRMREKKSAELGRLAKMRWEE